MSQRTLVLAALIVSLIGFAGAWPSESHAQESGAYPAVPCEDPAAEIAGRRRKACRCDAVPGGECAYDSQQSSCLADTLICRDDACNGLTDFRPLNTRCADVPSDQTNIPNLLLVVSDDANWAMIGDIDNETTGERYSLWDEHFKRLACHGGPDAGAVCGPYATCTSPGHCLTWTRRCSAGPLAGNPCKQDPDCGGNGAVCERCPMGGCSLNPIRTPNLDTLAESGAFFPVAHTTGAVCAPSVMSMLTGRYRKDFAPPSLPISNVTLPRVLADTHCSVSVGKTWGDNYDQSSRCYDCCCEAAGCCDDVASCPPSCSPEICCGDSQTGFHYSVQKEYWDTRSVKKVGREKRGLERGACIVREINQSGKAFFTWLMPYAPHAPKGAPQPLRSCYRAGLRDARLRVDGVWSRFRSPDYLGRLSWMDCMLGTFLDFLETTPDTRFCPDPGGAGAGEDRHCGPCARPCDEQNPCGDGVACVDGLCANDLPCLIDTTVILFLNDNGKALGASKGRFRENGYRTPMMLSYRGLGSYAGDALAGMPPAIEPEIYTDRLSHALDIVPTLLDYAGSGDPCLTSCAPECGTCGACLLGDDSDGRCDPYPGRSLRQLVESPGSEPWRSYLFGFRNLKNRLPYGDNAHYVRSEPMVGPNVPDTTGVGQCDSDADCTTQGWSEATRFGLDRCVNRVCTRECEGNGDCQIPALGESLDCVNGFCASTNACKLYHFPGRCTAELYNLAHDPGEQRNLLRVSASTRADVDPLSVCYGTEPGSRGRELYEEMSCELVQWCLDLCSTDPEFPCGECCAPQFCNE